MKKFYILWAIPFILISITILFLDIPKILIDNFVVLLSTNITIAIFSVNFSFFQYQYNIYKNITKNVSNIHITLSVITLILSVSPLILFNYPIAFLTKFSLFLTPWIIYMGIWVSLIVRKAISPHSIIANYSREDVINDFINDFKPLIISHLNHIEELRLSDIKDEPSHEWSLNTSPNSIDDDPFETLLSIGVEAIKNTDISSFESVTNALLYSSRLIHNKKIENKKPEGYEIKGVLQNHCYSMITSLGKATFEYDKTFIFSKIYLNIADNYLRTLATEYLQLSDLFSQIIFSMRDLAKYLIENGHFDEALIPIIIARQSAEKVIHCEEEPDIVFKANSTYLVKNIIKELGSKAIELKETDFLYRCLDAIGWLGCSAVKSNEFDMGLICLQELVQLGREARANNLECFWSRCALQPIDHAQERMWWMLSWVHSRPEDKIPVWIKSFEEAYSRLFGYSTKVTLEHENGSPTFKFEQSKEPHKFSFANNNVFRTVDYSDFNFLKDYHLY